MFARLASLFRLRTRVSLTFSNSFNRKFLTRLFCNFRAGFFPIPTREMNKWYEFVDKQSVASVVIFYTLVFSFPLMATRDVFFPFQNCCWLPLYIHSCLVTLIKENLPLSNESGFCILLILFSFFFIWVGLI